MYIGARLIGIGAYVIVLFSFLFCIRHVYSSKIKKVLNAFLIIYICMAFFYEPAYESDLFRIRIYADNFSTLQWSEFISRLKNGTIGLSSSPIAAVAYKILGDIGVLELIPALSCLIVLGVTFFVVCDVQKRYKLSGAAVAMAMFWFMAADYYMPTISTIRSYVSCALVFICVYRESINRRFGFLEIVLYIVSAMVHSLGVVLIGIRITAVVFQKDSRALWKILYALFVMIVLSIIIAINPSFISDTYKYAASYMTSDSGYSYIWEYVILFLVLFGQIYTVWIAKRQIRNIDKNMLMLLNVNRVCVILLIGFFWQFSIFQRLSFFSALLSLPFVEILNKNVAKYNKWSVNVYSVTASCLLLLTCTRGYLCSLKFW